MNFYCWITRYCYQRKVDNVFKLLLKLWYKLPDRKITVNLAPADLKKEGTFFDLPIAIGILQTAKLLHVASSYLEETLFGRIISMMALSNQLKGALAIAYDAKKLGKKNYFTTN